MKKRRHLQTDFVKFIIEKYSNLPEEDVEVDEDENDEPQQKSYRKKLKQLNEFEDDDNVEVQDEDEPSEDDEIIDELLNEYKRLKKKYENNRISNRRRK